MLWFGKKKKVDVPENNEKEIEMTDVQYDLDEDMEIASEEDILEELVEDDRVADAPESDDAETDDTEEDNAEEIAAKQDVTKIISSFDELVDFVNAKPIGGIQFMRKENNEAFTLREVYLRIARVWGSVSMAREYTAQEYAKIMLAIEVIEEPDAFYVLPVVADEEREKAIADFSEEKYGNGKKYAKNPSKFAKAVNENGDKEEWLAYAKQVMSDKIAEFCETKGIAFVPTYTEKTEDNADE